MKTNVLGDLYPNQNKLVFKNGGLTTEIIDEEFDAYKVEFDYDECARIITEGYTHITLSIESLYRLIYLIEKSERIYDNVSKKRRICSHIRTRMKRKAAERQTPTDSYQYAES